jgi:aryl-alcohol dehydrogenase-like predicted oxidoreductase
LTGKYRRGQPLPQGRLTEGGGYGALLSEKNLETVERLIAFAQRKHRTILELAISWLLARPVVASVIAGATRPEQVRTNAAAAGWRLTPEELAEVDRLLG